MMDRLRLMQQFRRQKMNKYGNRRVFYDGHWFDSKLERDRYIQLRLLERAGEIKGLRLQVPFELQEAYKNSKAS